MNLTRLKTFRWDRKAKHLYQFCWRFLREIPWKSPPVIGSVLFFILLIGSAAYALTTPPATVATGPENSQGGTDQTGRSLPGTGLQEAYKLEIDGSLVAYLPSQADIDKTLQAYQDYYTKPSEQNKITTVSFAEKVTSAKTEVSGSEISSPDQVLQMLIAGKTTAKDYTVQPNDSWWLIARKSDMLTKEVLAGNPGKTEDSKLEPGQVIKLVSVSPYLTVLSTGTRTENETIAFDTVTNVDKSLARGQTKVVTDGTNGSKTVTYAYQQLNGRDVKKEVVSEQIVTPAVTKVIAKGPAPQPLEVASRGGGDPGPSSIDPSGIVNYAQSLVGRPYVFGGASPSGFDCSGFTQYVYGKAGISLPRSSFSQYASGQAVSKSNLQPGDLVFFQTYSKGASHVGIYIGGGRFVHADNPRLDVTITSLGDTYYSSHYLGARRY
jgi:cell wall-associated NlpC family hydrolase